MLPTHNLIKMRHKEKLVLDLPHKCISLIKVLESAGFAAVVCSTRMYLADVAHVAVMVWQYPKSCIDGAQSEKRHLVSLKCIFGKRGKKASIFLKKLFMKSNVQKNLLSEKDYCIHILKQKIFTVIYSLRINLTHFTLIYNGTLNILPIRKQTSTG